MCVQSNGIPGWATEVTREVDQLFPGLLYADDIVLISPTAEKLRDSLVKIGELAHVHGMQYNAEKCGVMIIDSDEADNALQWQIAGEAIPVVQDYKYLGVKFTNSLSLVEMAKDRIEIATRAWKGTERFFTSLRTPLHIRRKAFNSLVVPKVMYGG